MPRRVKTKAQLVEEHQRVNNRLALVRSYSGPDSDGGTHRAELRAMLKVLRWAMGVDDDSPSSEWRT